MTIYRNASDTDAADPVVVLKNFGFAPIPTDKIAAYKAHQLVVHNGNFWWHVANFFGIDPGGTTPEGRAWNIRVIKHVWNVLRIFAGNAAGFAFLWAMCRIFPASRRTADIFFDFGGASLVICAVCIGMMWIAHEVKVVYPGIWNDVDYYPHVPAPGWVHNIVTRVRAIYPDAKFTVSELREKEVWGLLDPILSAEIGGQLIPLAVWDKHGERVDL